MKKPLSYFLLMMILFQCTTIVAQKTDIGVSLGILGSRYTVADNSPPGSVIVRQGDVFPGGSIGISSISGPSRDQPFYTLKLYSLLLTELNYVYSGGNVDLMRTNVKNRHFNELKYVTQLLNLNVLYLGKLRNFRFMLGPSLMYSLQRNVSINNAKKTSAENQLEHYVLHGEIGVGWKINRFLLSSRYNFSITDFSRETPSIQTSYNAYQLRLVVTYFFYQRAFEKNRNSIIWK